MQSETIDVDVRLEAIEQLVKTLVALLSARDPKLLDELQAVFDSSDFATDPAGRSAAEAWARVSEGLAATRTMVDSLKDPQTRAR